MQNLASKLMENDTNDGINMVEPGEDILGSAQLALDGGDNDRALQLYKQATVAMPDHAEAWAGLGDAYSALVEPAEAIAAYSRASEMAPDNGEYFLAQGRELLGQERYADAEPKLTRGLLLDILKGEDASDDWYNLGLCVYHQGSPAAALPFCEKALSFGTDPDSEQLLANCCFDLSAFDDAARHYENVLDHDPGHADSAANLGKSYEYLSRYEDAVTMLQKALSADPQNAELWASLSRCYGNLGQTDDANAAAEKYNALTGQPASQ